MSIAEKLTYLQTTKQLIKTEINKINNVLTDNSTFRSYPQELFNGYLDILNNGTDTLWNNLEKVSQTGTEAVLEGVETAPMKMVLNGNTSQDGTPTPDTPVEVKVVKGENVVSVSGKNLFSGLVKNVRLDPNNGEQFSGSTGATSDYIPVNIVSSNAYYLSGLVDTIRSFTCAYNSNKEFLGRTSAQATSEKALTVGSFTAGTPTGTGDIAYIRITQYIQGEGTIDIIDGAKIQLEQGSTATPYVPYSKTDCPINLGTLELCKIGNYQDYLYKNNGKWYLHKEIGKGIYNLTREGMTIGNRKWFYFNKPSDSIDFNTYNTNAITEVALIGNSQSTLDIFFSGNGGVTLYAIVYQNTATAPTLAELQEKVNGKSYYYVLKTPTEEEITNSTLIEQLEAISNAKSVKDKTYITQTNEELPFILDVEAIKEYSVE